jgi:diacylglycerol kinase family enzyme
MAVPVAEKRLPVLVNRSGGTAARLGDRLEADVRGAFEAAGVAIDLRLIRGDQMVEAVRAVADAPVVAVGGGDGTLGCAAGVLADSATALAILPLGTRNHLAHELGIPDDLVEVARLIARGPTRRIDLGRVGERVFVNNASIGLYPALVRRRDERQGPKWLAALPASLEALGGMRHHRLRLVLDGERQPVVTPLLFVGNNRYTLERKAIGTREALDDGMLSVYAVASRRRLGLIGFALRTLIGRADPERDFAAIGETRRLTIEGRRHHIDVALDGEVVRLTLPFTLVNDAGALTVIAPA